MRTSYVARAVALVLALVLLSSAAPGGAAVPREEQAAALPDARPLYRIGLGDVLDIFSYEDNQHYLVTVRPDGRITLPLAGDIVAEDATGPELTAKIKKALEPYQKDPTITVAVTQINSYRVYVLGNVRTQMMVASTTPLRVLQALAMAGGLNDYANKNVIVLRERKTGGALRIPVSYSRIIKGDALDQNIWLEPGDVVIAE